MLSWEGSGRMGMKIWYRIGRREVGSSVLGRTAVTRRRIRSTHFQSINHGHLRAQCNRASNATRAKSYINILVQSRYSSTSKHLPATKRGLRRISHILQPPLQPYPDRIRESPTMMPTPPMLDNPAAFHRQAVIFGTSSILSGLPA